MKKRILKTTQMSYPILIGSGLLASIGSKLKSICRGSKVLIVSNRKVGGFFLKAVESSLKKSGYSVSVYLLPHGNERDKSAEGLLALWKKMAEIPLSRDSALVALGGGVVGDLAGFAAATYMRGIALVHVPTTLLAQVDSSVGGKTAIDLNIAKNIVGSFYQPRLVLMDPKTLQTFLKDRAGLAHLRSSFAEIIKYGVISDVKLFGLLEERVENFFLGLKKKKVFTQNQVSFLETVIARSVHSKACVVEADERETKGKRAILNFGHTFAHAFETASNYKLSHGEAVAVGMLCAARLAVLLKLFSPQEENRLFELVRSVGLPTSLTRYRLRSKNVLSAMHRDKKKHAGKLNFVLPLRIGKVVLRAGIPEKVVLRVLREFGVKS